MTIFDLFFNLNHHLLSDERPSAYLNEIYENELFGTYPFSLLSDLKKVEQSPVHHPEGNVWNHTLLVIDEAARQREKSKTPGIFMWAALLHDIGKASATRLRKGRITAYDHDKIGAGLSKDFLSVFTDDENFINGVSQLIRYHMQLLFVVKEMPFADIEGLKRNTDVKELALLGFCDRVGRKDPDRALEEENVGLFLKKCT